MSINTGNKNSIDYTHEFYKPNNIVEDNRSHGGRLKVKIQDSLYQQIMGGADEIMDGADEIIKNKTQSEAAVTSQNLKIRNEISKAMGLAKIALTHIKGRKKKFLSRNEYENIKKTFQERLSIDSPNHLRPFDPSMLVDTCRGRPKVKIKDSLYQQIMGGADEIMDGADEIIKNKTQSEAAVISQSLTTYAAISKAMGLASTTLREIKRKNRTFLSRDEYEKITKIFRERLAADSLNHLRPLDPSMLVEDNRGKNYMEKDEIIKNKTQSEAAVISLSLTTYAAISKAMGLTYTTLSEIKTKRRTFLSRDEYEKITKIFRERLAADSLNHLRPLDPSMLVEDNRGMNYMEKKVKIKKPLYQQIMGGADEIIKNKTQSEAAVINHPQKIPASNNALTKKVHHLDRVPVDHILKKAKTILNNDQPSPLYQNAVPVYRSFSLEGAFQSTQEATTTYPIENETEYQHSAREQTAFRIDDDLFYNIDEDLLFLPADPVETPPTNTQTSSAQDDLFLTFSSDDDAFPLESTNEKTISNNATVSFPNKNKLDSSNNTKSESLTTSKSLPNYSAISREMRLDQSILSQIKGNLKRYLVQDEYEKIKKIFQERLSPNSPNLLEPFESYKLSVINPRKFPTSKKKFPKPIKIRIEESLQKKIVGGADEIIKKETQSKAPVHKKFKAAVINHLPEKPASNNALTEEVNLLNQLPVEHVSKKVKAILNNHQPSTLYQGAVPAYQSFPVYQSFFNETQSEAPVHKNFKAAVINPPPEKSASNNDLTKKVNSLNQLPVEHVSKKGKAILNNHQPSPLYQGAVPVYQSFPVYQFINESGEKISSKSFPNKNKLDSSNNTKSKSLKSRSGISKAMGLTKTTLSDIKAEKRKYLSRDEYEKITKIFRERLAADSLNHLRPFDPSMLVDANRGKNYMEKKVKIKKPLYQKIMGGVDEILKNKTQDAAPAPQGAPTTFPIENNQPSAPEQTACVDDDWIYNIPQDPLFLPAGSIQTSLPNPQASSAQMPLGGLFPPSFPDDDVFPLEREHWGCINELH